MGGGRLARELLDHGAGDGRSQQRVAACDDANGGGDLLGPRVLQHEAARARAKRVVDVAVQPEGGQDHHPRAVAGADDPAGGLDPVQHRHAHVHQHHLRSQPGRVGDRLLPVTGLADHGHVRLAVEDLAQADAHQLLVVDDQQRGHVTGRVTCTTNPPPGSRAASSLPP